MADIPPFGGPLSRGDTLGDQVTRALRSSVTDGTWPLGAALPSEARLATDMQVSRTVIREAVSCLKAESLLSSRQGQGTPVASDRPRQGFAIAEDEVADLRNLSQILELRMGLEAEIATLAAREQMRCHLAQASERLLGQLRARSGDTA